MWAILILSLASLMTSTQGTIVVSNGTCPDIPLKPNFEVERYLGKWYSYESFKAPYQTGLSCISAEYGLLPDGNISVLNSGLRKFFSCGILLNSTKEEAEGKAIVVDDNEPAGLAVGFPEPSESDLGDANYLVLDTDYETYSLVYTCNDAFNMSIKTETAWILTRERGVAPANIEELKANLTDFNVDISNFNIIDNEDCDVTPPPS